MGTTRILVVDDQPEQRDLLRALLRERFAVEAAAGLLQALAALRKSAADLVITDLNMPEGSGLDLCRQVRDEWPLSELIVVTGEGRMETAIEALRLGVCDYLCKPFGKAQLHAAIDRALERRRMLQTLQRFQRADPGVGGMAALLGDSQPMERLRAAITRVQHAETTVLIQGPTGTGKELVARAIHQGSHRHAGPFIAVNSAAVTPDLLESELFGHEEGAFTGANKSKSGLLEEANKGTFFLDEVGELPLAIQAKMLRVIQEREVQRLGSTRTRPIDVRLIAATNRNLATEVEAGRFRQDLFYRLNVFPLRTPALSAHPEDIELLARHFAAGRAAAMGLATPTLEPELLAELASRSWPGNVRELANVLERVVLLAEGPRLGVEHLVAADGLEAGGPAEARPASPPPEGLEMTLDQLEMTHVERVLARCGGNKSQAARILGIHPATLNRKLGR